VDIEQDQLYFCQAKRTGWKRPERENDIQFVDFSEKIGSKEGLKAIKNMRASQDSGRGVEPLNETTNGSRAKDSYRSKNLEFYSNLPPEQRCRKLDAKMTAVSSEVAAMEKELHGLKILRDSYKSEPGLGNPKTVQQPIDRLILKIDNMKNHYNQLSSLHQSSLTALEKIKTSPRREKSPKPQSSSTSNLIPQNTYNMKKSSTSTSLKNTQKWAPPNCLKTASYDFEGEPKESTISIREGDKLEIITSDYDGWTEVKKCGSNIIGFVPTSYLE